MADLRKREAARGRRPQKRTRIRQEARSGGPATQQRPAKYGNVKQTADNQVFDSKHELQVWRDLQARQAAGEITELRHHPEAIELLTVASEGEEFFPAVCRYEPDFVYREGDRLVIADAKSPVTRKNAVYRLKARWLKAQENIEIVEL